MELERKFINGTNEQYSMTEDGIFLSHYRRRIIRGKEIKINKVKQLIVDKYANQVNILNKNRSVKVLIFEHFGYSFCKQCNKKLDYNPRSAICKECLKENYKASMKKYYSTDYAIKKRSADVKKYKKNNPEVYKAMNKRSSIKYIEKVTKGYVAMCLDIPVKDITDEVYNYHRNNLLFKRELAKKYNLHMTSFN
tara:strand:+ start:89 stop:670 length:582 start_codon:yes stop_codon:yes gene_type:complete